MTLNTICHGCEEWDQAARMYCVDDELLCRKCYKQRTNQKYDFL